MNKDIRISTSFFTHIKTRKSIKKYGSDFVLCLFKLWIYAAQNRAKGILEGLSSDDIDLLSDWGGDLQFTDICLELGWLDKDENGVFSIHGWEEHQSFAMFAEERSAKARRAASKRWGCKENSNEEDVAMQDDCSEHASSIDVAMQDDCSEHASSIDVAMQDDCSAYAPSPIPSPSPLPNPVPKPEFKYNLPAPIPSGQEVQCLDAFMGLTLNTGDSHPVTHAEIDVWQDLYPAVNVEQEIRNMQGWLLADKRRRKTKQGIGRFIQSWLSRAQDKHYAPQQAQQGQRPTANTQWQKDRQNSQDLAKMALALREQEKENGITTVDI